MATKQTATDRAIAYGSIARGVAYGAATCTMKAGDICLDPAPRTYDTAQRAAGADDAAAARVARNPSVIAANTLAARCFADLDAAILAGVAAGIWGIWRTQKVTVRAIELHDAAIECLRAALDSAYADDRANAAAQKLIMPEEQELLAEIDAIYANGTPSSEVSSDPEVSNPKPKVSVLDSFNFGKSKLDEKIDDFAGLAEFSPAKYAIMIRRFKGEKNYDAPPVNFLGHSWQLMLQTVHGQICKIAIDILLSNKREANPIAMGALQYCEERLGSPTEQQTGLFVWDTKAGNVVLQTGESADGFVIGIYLTSQAIRKFELL